MPDIKKVYTPAGSGATVVKGKVPTQVGGGTMSGEKPKEMDGKFAKGASNQRCLK